MRLSTPSLLIAASLVAGTLAGPAKAAEFIYRADLSGPAEAPPNASPGLGTSIVIYDDVARTLRVQATFSGLLPTTATGAPSGVTVAHIHATTPTPFAGVAGVATPTPTFPGFPVGVREGSYDQTCSLLLASSFNPAFVTANGGTPAGAEAALVSALGSGRAYFNIHSNAFPGGEIRGFFSLASAVPEPTTWITMILGFGLVGGALRTRSRVPAAA